MQDRFRFELDIRSRALQNTLTLPLLEPPRFEDKMLILAKCNPFRWRCFWNKSINHPSTQGTEIEQMVLKQVQIIRTRKRRAQAQQFTSS